MSNSIDLKNTWVLEWSELNNDFHIDTLDYTIQRNQIAYYNSNSNSNKKNDYKILALAASQDEAVEIRKQIEKLKIDHNNK